MTDIRPIEEGDLVQVAELIREHLPGWSRDVDFLRASLLTHPWAGPDPPSLVAVEGDTVVGSIGAQRRRLLFQGEPREGVVVSHFVVSPERRQGPGAVRLLRRLVDGPQDLTFTDSGTDVVVRLWGVFGGRVDSTRTLDWLLTLKPGRWLRSVGLSAGRGRGAPARADLPVAALPLQAGGRRLVRRAFPVLPPDVSSRDASVGEIAGQIGATPAETSLRVAYDEAALAHAFEHIKVRSPHPLIHRIVLRDGAPIGWYAYIARPALGRVVAIGANTRTAEPVVAELVSDATRRGLGAICGRLEPHLDEPLRRRFAVMGFAQLPIVQAKDPALLATLSSSASLLTELDLIDTPWW